jgi:hypothetical protein
MSDDFSIWDVFVSMFWFMLLFAWIMLLFHIIADIFRDRELGGFAKAMWCLFLIFIPWIGALVYLIARGNSMTQRSIEAAKENEANMRAYVREAAGTTSAADELAKLAEMRDSGAITPEDYEKAKAKVLA